MGTVYGILGKGSAPDKAIEASLYDLSAESIFYIFKDGKTSDGQAAVFNWVINNERTFNVYGKGIGEALREAATKTDMGTCQSVIDEVILEGGDTVLVLWDDSPELEDGIVYAASKGLKVLELSNGLTPIEVEADSPPSEPVLAVPAIAPADYADPVDQDDEEPSWWFSREELEAMPAAAVKRNATKKGVDIKGLTKMEIIDKMFSHDELLVGGYNPTVLGPPLTDPYMASPAKEGATPEWGDLHAILKVVVDSFPPSYGREQAFLKLQEFRMWMFEAEKAAGTVGTSTQ